MICNVVVWLNIFQFLSCRTLKSTVLLSKQFHRVIIDNDLFNKAKMYGFPRKEMVCNTYNVLEDYPDLCDNNIDIMINKIEEHADTIGMIRGDMVITNEIKNIFDGSKLVELPSPGGEDHDLLLDKFLTEKVTLGYWYGTRTRTYDQLYYESVYNLVIRKNGSNKYNVIGKLNAKSEIIPLTELDYVVCKELGVSYK